MAAFSSDITRGSVLAIAHRRSSARTRAIRTDQASRALTTVTANLRAAPANRANAAKPTNHKAIQATMRCPSTHVFINWSATTTSADTMAASNMALRPLVLSKPRRIAPATDPVRACWAGKLECIKLAMMKSFLQCPTKMMKTHRHIRVYTHMYQVYMCDAVYSHQ